MAQALASATQSVRELTARASADLLAKAVRARSIVRVELDDGSDRTCCARLVGADGARLMLAADEGPGSTLLPTSAPLLVNLTVAGRRYTFASRCVVESTASPEDAVAITRPRSVAAVERRRSRRRFMGNTTVTLTHATETGPVHYRAAMLNLSADGLACRVSAAEADALTRERTVRAQFALGSPPVPLEVTGRLVSRTDAGTPGQVVLGLEFLEDEASRAARERIGQVATTGAA